MLVPVVAFNVGVNTGYIKLGNGLLIQWGQKVVPSTNDSIPIDILSYSDTKYFAIVNRSWTDFQTVVLAGDLVAKNKSENKFFVRGYNSPLYWVTVGY